CDSDDRCIGENRQACDCFRAGLARRRRVGHASRTGQPRTSGRSAVPMSQAAMLSKKDVPQMLDSPRSATPATTRNAIVTPPSERRPQASWHRGMLFWIAALAIILLGQLAA